MICDNINECDTNSKIILGIIIGAVSSVVITLGTFIYNKCYKKKNVYKAEFELSPELLRL